MEVLLSVRWGGSEMCDPTSLQSTPLSSRNLSDTSIYKNRNWHRRNVLKIMPPQEYHPGADAALDAAGLQELP